MRIVIVVWLAFMLLAGAGLYIDHDDKVGLFMCGLAIGMGAFHAYWWGYANGLYRAAAVLSGTLTSASDRLEAKRKELHAQSKAPTQDHASPAA